MHARIGVEAAAGVHLLPQLAGVNPVPAPVKDVLGQGEVAESGAVGTRRGSEKRCPSLAAALPWPRVYAEVPQDGSLAYKITRICLVPLCGFREVGRRSSGGYLEKRTRRTGTKRQWQGQFRPSYLEP